jgi:formate hydrogenlyase transcriptional activator
VRELQNVIERSLILCESELFSLDDSWPGEGEAAHLPTPAREPTPGEAPVAAPRPLRLTLDEIQRAAILDALRSRNWVVGGPRGAAALLGNKRTTLQARMQKLGIPARQPTARAVEAP